MWAAYSGVIPMGRSSAIVCNDEGKFNGLPP